jgi:hypothetical protein
LQGALCVDGWRIFAICESCKRSGKLAHLRGLVAAGGEESRCVSDEFVQSIPGGLVDIGTESVS